MWHLDWKEVPHHKWKAFVIIVKPLGSHVKPDDRQLSGRVQTPSSFTLEVSRSVSSCQIFQLQCLCLRASFWNPTFPIARWLFSTRASSHILINRPLETGVQGDENFTLQCGITGRKGQTLFGTFPSVLTIWCWLMSALNHVPSTWHFWTRGLSEFLRWRPLPSWPVASMGGFFEASFRHYFLEMCFNPFNLTVSFF